MARYYAEERLGECDCGTLPLAQSIIRYLCATAAGDDVLHLTIWCCRRNAPSAFSSATFEELAVSYFRESGRVGHVCCKADELITRKCATLSRKGEKVWRVAAFSTSASRSAQNKDFVVSSYNLPLALKHRYMCMRGPRSLVTILCYIAIQSNAFLSAWGLRNHSPFITVHFVIKVAHCTARSSTGT